MTSQSPLTSEPGLKFTNPGLLDLPILVQSKICEFEPWTSGLWYLWTSTLSYLLWKTDTTKIIRAVSI